MAKYSYKELNSMSVEQLKKLDRELLSKTPALSKPQYPGKPQELSPCLEEERLLTEAHEGMTLEFWAKELGAHIIQYGGAANYPAGECFGTPPGTSLTRSGCGDMNGDGGLNVLDVVTLVNCVLGGGDCDCEGDLNGDGGYNVLDVVTLVNCVLAGDNPCDDNCCSGESDCSEDPAGVCCKVDGCVMDDYGEHFTVCSEDLPANRGQRSRGYCLDGEPNCGACCTSNMDFCWDFHGASSGVGSGPDVCLWQDEVDWTEYTNQEDCEAATPAGIWQPGPPYIAHPLCVDICVQGDNYNFAGENNDGCNYQPAPVFGGGEPCRYNSIMDGGNYPWINCSFSDYKCCGAWSNAGPDDTTCCETGSLPSGAPGGNSCNAQGSIPVDCAPEDALTCEELFDGGCGTVPDCDILDECGVCGGDGPEPNYDCDGNCANLGCDGCCGSGKVEDQCGVCGGPGKCDCPGAGGISCNCNWSFEAAYPGGYCTEDCAGVYGCIGDNDNMLSYQCRAHCIGNCKTCYINNGTDECGTCDGDNSSCSDWCGVPGCPAQCIGCYDCDGNEDWWSSYCASLPINHPDCFEGYSASNGCTPSIYDYPSCGDASYGSWCDTQG